MVSDAFAKEKGIQFLVHNFLDTTRNWIPLVQLGPRSPTTYGRQYRRLREGVVNYEFAWPQNQIV
jgi:hypothetical protein